MRYSLSLSYGKDSMACIEAVKRLGLPLDEIVTMDLYATDTLSANHPDTEEFKAYADREILKRYGFKVKHLRGETFEDRFYRKKVQGKYKGLIYGFPTANHAAWCMKYLKVVPYQDYLKKIKDTAIIYMGIAADERERAE